MSKLRGLAVGDARADEPFPQFAGVIRWALRAVESVVRDRRMASGTVVHRSLDFGALVNFGIFGGVPECGLAKTPVIDTEALVGKGFSAWQRRRVAKPVPCR